MSRVCSLGPENYRHLSLIFQIQGLICTFIGFDTEIYYRSGKFHDIGFAGRFATPIIGLSLAASELILSSLLLTTMGPGSPGSVRH